MVFSVTFSQIRIFMGKLQVNQQEIAQTWSKTDQTPVTFTYTPSYNDTWIIT